MHGYLPTILEGALLTLAVAACSLLIAMGLGFAGALAKLRRRGALKHMATAYTTVIRGVPDLVLMLLIFYGGQIAINRLAPMVGYTDYIDVNPFIAGVLTLGFIFGAYLTETFRGAILAVPSGQAEAARAYGMTRLQTFARIVAPQMIRHAIPGFTNNWLVLVKSTALVSVIGLTDMMQRAGLAAGATKEPFTFYAAVGVIYLAITTVSIAILRLAEKRYSLGVKAVHG